MPVIDLKKSETRDLVPGFKVKFVHTENVTMAYWQVEKDALLPEHTHHHEQITNIIEGEFELAIDSEIKVLTPGTVAVIPSNALHSGRALTPCRIIDVFYPIREDYL